MAVEEHFSNITFSRTLSEDNLPVTGKSSTSRIWVGVHQGAKDLFTRIHLVLAPRLRCMIFRRLKLNIAG